MNAVLKRAAVAACLALAVAAPSAAAAPPKRIVTLTPFTANTVAELGVKPVGVGLVLGGSDRINPRLKGVKVLPLSHPNGPNMEQLATLNPDLVLSAPTWRKGHETMKQLKIKVVESEPTSVRGVPRETRRIGGLLGKGAAAEKLARKQERGVKAASKNIKTKPRVLVILGVGRTPFAFLKNSWGGDVVSRAGGRLLTEGLTASGGFARISDEVIVERNPDIIIGVPHGNPDDIDGIADYMRNNPAWQTTNAAKSGRIYVATGNSLLQPFTDPGRTIKDVRVKFLKNW